MARLLKPLGLPPLAAESALSAFLPFSTLSLPPDCPNELRWHHGTNNKVGCPMLRLLHLARTSHASWFAGFVKTATQNLDWDPPQATLLSTAVDPSGWSPQPTPAPHAADVELRKRDDAAQVCGYMADTPDSTPATTTLLFSPVADPFMLTRVSSSAFRCGPEEGCLINSGRRAVGCCNGQDVKGQGCEVATACLASQQLPVPRLDPLTTACGAAAPACITYVYAGNEGDNMVGYSAFACAQTPLVVYMTANAPDGKHSPSFTQQTGPDAEPTTDPNSNPKTQANDDQDQTNAPNATPTGTPGPVPTHNSKEFSKDAGATSDSDPSSTNDGDATTTSDGNSPTSTSDENATTSTGPNDQSLTSTTSSTESEPNTVPSTEPPGNQTSGPAEATSAAPEDTAKVRPDIGAIVGGIAGGVIGVLLITAAIILITNHRRRKRQAMEAEAEANRNMPQPNLGPQPMPPMQPMNEPMYHQPEMAMADETHTRGVGGGPDPYASSIYPPHPGTPYDPTNYETMPSMPAYAANTNTNNNGATAHPSVGASIAAAATDGNPHPETTRAYWEEFNPYSAYAGGGDTYDPDHGHPDATRPGDYEGTRGAPSAYGMPSRLQTPGPVHGGAPISPVDASPTTPNSPPDSPDPRFEHLSHRQSSFSPYNMLSPPPPRSHRPHDSPDS